MICEHDVGLTRNAPPRNGFEVKEDSPVAEEDQRLDVLCFTGTVRSHMDYVPSRIHEVFLALVFTSWCVVGGMIYVLKPAWFGKQSDPRSGRYEGHRELIGTMKLEEQAFRVALVYVDDSEQAIHSEQRSTHVPRQQHSFNHFPIWSVEPTMIRVDNQSVRAFKNPIRNG